MSKDQRGDDDDQIGGILNGGGPTFKSWLVSRGIVTFSLSLKSWSTAIRVVKMKLVQLWVSPIGVSPNGVSPNGVSPIGGSPIGGSPSPIGGSPNGVGPRLDT